MKGPHQSMKSDSKKKNDFGSLTDHVGVLLGCGTLRFRAYEVAQQWSRIRRWEKADRVSKSPLVPCNVFINIVRGCGILESNGCLELQMEVAVNIQAIELAKVGCV